MVAIPLASHTSPDTTEDSVPHACAGVAVNGMQSSSDNERRVPQSWIDCDWCVVRALVNLAKTTLAVNG